MEKRNESAETFVIVHLLGMMRLLLNHDWLLWGQIEAIEKGKTPRQLDIPAIRKATSELHDQVRAMLAEISRRGVGEDDTVQ